MTYSPHWYYENSKGSSKSTASNFQNGTISTLSKGTPVSINISSNLVLVDVSDPINIQAMVGLTSISIPSAATGSVVDNGRLEDISTSFSIGDAIYISKTGELTNIKPEIGVNSFVAEDFIVFVGVIVKNEFNPSLKDIKLMISVVGQL